MSRSRKKHGVLKHRGMRRSHYNRIFRRVNKQRIQLGKEPKLMNELINPYNVCDYRFFWDVIYWRNAFASNKYRYIYDSFEQVRYRYFRK